MFSYGHGVPKDQKTAIKWYTLSAEQGYLYSQFNLGSIYDEGNGVPQDHKTAVKWYTLAAEQAYLDAQTALGLSYAFGKGVIQDVVFAHMWFNIASSNGHKEGRLQRRKLELKMTSSQIQEAQRLARECVKKNYKGC